MGFVVEKERRDCRETLWIYTAGIWFTRSSDEQMYSSRLLSMLMQQSGVVDDMVRASYGVFIVIPRPERNNVWGVGEGVWRGQVPRKYSVSKERSLILGAAFPMRNNEE